MTTDHLKYESSGALSSAPQQAQSILKIYAYYRMALSLIMIMLFFGDYSWKVAGTFNPHLYFVTCLCYGGLNLASLCYFIRKQFNSNKQQQLFIFVVDIIAIVMIIHTSGGIDTGLGALLAITVAAAGIFFESILAFLVAALATVGLILQNSYISYLEPNHIREFFGAGLLGILFFATSAAMQLLTKRIRSSQLLAESKTADAADLQRLNELIVQRMQTGIIVVGENSQVQMMNRAAGRMLAIPVNTAEPIPMRDINVSLAEQISHWTADPNMRPKPFQATENAPVIQANFAPLQRSATRRNQTLIFLEDTSKLTQQAQQIKLASLGRLTASIAHEIRNPLGAISHAAQLMQESDQLCTADLKLASIVQKHSRRMNQIIENVLQLSRRRPAHPEKLSAPDWLQQFVEEYCSHHPGDTEIRLDLHTDVSTLPFDPSQLQQVLTNLCQNGLRYSQQATGNASLLLKTHPDEKTSLPCLDIIDDGKGISDEAREKIFEPFYTTESTGTGLGLYICRELCEANQSRLDYFTQNGKSCFRLSFSHPDKNIASIINDENESNNSTIL